MDMHKVLCWMLALLLLGGCATTQVTTTNPEQAAAIALLEEGKPEQAAPRLEALAALATGPQRSALLADAAYAWLAAGDSNRARQLAAQVDPRRLPAASKVRQALVKAHLSLAEDQPASALAALDLPFATVPPAHYVDWHLTRARALEATGNLIPAAAERAAAHPLLKGEARADNQRNIDRLLSGLDDQALAARAAALPVGDPLYNFMGRALQRRGLPLPRPFDRGDQWLANTANRPPADRDGFRPPVKLAVLLPLSGDLATAAAPVRDGLLAGYYGEQRRRPEISFFDTKGTPAGALDAYAKAIAANADFVVGPLGRDEVTALFRESTLSVPMLALNRGALPPPDGSAGFSLTPEDDGLIGAEYLYSRERRHVVVIAGNDDNGRRAATAFREGFNERGGTIVETLNVGDTPGDLSAKLSAAARSGVDSVFLALRGNTARAVAPQLALAGLGDKSRVATSQLTSGTGKPEQDSALDGIVFPTERWGAYSIPGLPPPATLGERLPTARGPAARLFAFGHDAWLLTAFLEKLALDANSELPGATGILRLDGFGNVVRQPGWSTFSAGRPTPLTGVP